jgi:hypothetical protein
LFFLGPPLFLPLFVSSGDYNNYGFIVGNFLVCNLSWTGSDMWKRLVFKHFNVEFFPLLADSAHLHHRPFRQYSPLRRALSLVCVCACKALVVSAAASLCFSSLLLLVTEFSEVMYRDLLHFLNFFEARRFLFFFVLRFFFSFSGSIGCNLKSFFCVCILMKEWRSYYELGLLFFVWCLWEVSCEERFFLLLLLMMMMIMMLWDFNFIFFPGIFSATTFFQSKYFSELCNMGKGGVLATCCDILIAILLPPLGVFLKYGCMVRTLSFFILLSPL